MKHVVGDKIKWCYIGKALPQEYQELITDFGTQIGTQKGTQRIMKSNTPIPNSFQETKLVFRSRGWELNPYITALQAAA